jgi:glycosyltransferase involved in cell wall biosynthesis
MTTYAKGISVLICSYNGSKRIAATLQHLASQHTQTNVDWEIVLVDNASTDQLIETAKAHWSTQSSLVPFRIVQEPKAGKNNAFDKGLQQARYQYILICDDDNWLATDYIQTTWDIVNSHPEIGMLGGRGIAKFEVPPPDWFPQYESYFAVGSQSHASGEVLTSKGFLWGAGAVINRGAYDRLHAAGFRKILTYENFPELARGEDVELCLAIRLTGYKIWYDDRLIYRHFIDAGKLSWNYLMQLTRQGSKMSIILEPYQFLYRHRNRSNPVYHSDLTKRIIRYFLNLREIRTLVSGLLTLRHEGNPTYHHYVNRLYVWLGYWQVLSKHPDLSEQVNRLYKALNQTVTQPTVIP